MPTPFTSEISFSALQQDPASVLAALHVSGGLTAVTQGEETTAVLMSLDTWKQHEKERQLLLRLAQGEAEIAAGRGYSLDEVLSEADALLSSPQQ